MKKKFSLLAIALFFLFTPVSFANSQDLINSNTRYPIYFEYLFINGCVNDDSGILDINYSQKQFEICIYILQVLRNRIDFNIFENYRDNQKNEVVKEVVKKAVKEVAKEAGKEVAKEAGKEIEGKFLISEGKFNLTKLYANEPNIPNRYPTIDEYRIINGCLNDDQIVFSDDYREQFKHCVDTIEKTMNDISYSEYSSNPSKFDKTFNKYFNDE